MLLIGKKRDKGFFLLELTLGISLISIGLLSILGSFAKSMAAEKVSEYYFKAGILLEENIYLAYNTNKTEGVREDIFQAYHGRFAWRADIKEIDGGLLNEAVFEAFSRYGKPDVSLSIVTYI
jgi:Tfp pilus assembly protein PilV